MESHSSIGGRSAAEAMPISYGALLLLWSLPFAVLVLMLVGFYGGVLLICVLMFLAELAHPSNNNGPLFVSLLGMITGAYLLAILAKAIATVQVPQGVRLRDGSFPRLESLIHECTTKAGIEAPDDIFIVPDAMAYAYSSGRLSLHERLNHYVLIGAPLLVYLAPLDLAAVLFHEFGHLALRRGSWAVSLHHKIDDFLSRFLQAQVYKQGCALFFTFAPAIMIGLFLRVFRRSLAGFSKREELMVDKIAARWMGERQFREGLVRSITTIGALQARVDGDRSPVEQINKEFHRRLMAATRTPGGSGTVPNYFDVASRVPAEDRVRWDDRLASVYEKLITEVSGPTDSHPSLSERVGKLHGVVDPDLAFYPSSRVHMLHVPVDAGTMISSEFASDLRAIFFKEKIAARLKPIDGMTSESVVEFRCRHRACPRLREVEVTLTEDRLHLFFTGVKHDLRWCDIGRVSVNTGSDFNFFTQAARAFGSALRGAPSDRVLRLQMANGGVIEFPHWHLMDNCYELEALVQELWSLPRVFGSVTDEAGHPVPDTVIRLHDESGAVYGTAVSEQDGSYSLTMWRSARWIIAVHAPGFIEFFAPCEPKPRQQIQIVLRTAQSADAIRSALPSKQVPTTALQKSDRGRAKVFFKSLLALLLKLGCAVLGFLTPFAVATILVLQENSDPTRAAVAWAGWMTPCIVIGFGTGAIGWRIGDRLALKYIFVRVEKP